MVLGFGVVGGVGAVLWLQSESGNEWLRVQLGSLIQGGLAQGEVELQGLHTDLFWNWTLDGVAVRGPQGESLLELESLAVELDPWALLRREVHLRSLSLSSADVRLTFDEAGVLDLIALLPPGDPDVVPGPWGGLPLATRVDSFDLGSLSIDLGSLASAGAEREVLLSTKGDLRGWFEGQGRVLRLHQLQVETDWTVPDLGPVAVAGEAAFDDGDLVLDDLVVLGGDTRVELDGRVLDLEEELSLDLSLVLPQVRRGDIARVVGSELLRVDPRLEAHLEGPLASLAVEGTLSHDEVGSLGFALGANLASERPSWTARFDSEAFALDLLMADLPEPVRLAPHLQLEGNGLTWPEDLDVDVRLEAGPQVIWGEAVSSMLVQGRLSSGVFTLADGSVVQHALGRVDASGDVRILESTTQLEATVALPRLARLSAYGVDGLRGAATYGGRVRADWSGEAVTAEASGRLSATAIDFQGNTVGTIQGPLDLHLGAQSQGAEGRLAVTEVRSGDLTVDQGLLVFTASASGARQKVSLGVGLGRLRYGDLLEVDDVSGTIQAGADGRGSVASGELVLGHIQVGTAGLGGEEGTITFDLSPDAVHARVELLSDGEPMATVDAAADPTFRSWRLDELYVAAGPERTLRAPQPITFTLDDGAVRDLALRLEGPSGIVDLSGHVDPADLEDLALRVHLTSLNLAHVAEVVGDLGLDEGRSMAGLEGQLTGVMDVVGGESGPSLQGTASLRGLSFPGQVDDLDLGLRLGGTGALPTVDLAMRREGLLLGRARVEVPLRSEAGALGIDCGAPIWGRATLAPVNTASLTEALPALGELETATLSAELGLAGMACDPEIDVVVALRTPINEARDRVRVDLALHRRSGVSELVLELEDDLARRVRLDASGTDRLAELLPGLLEGDSEGMPDDLEGWLPQLTWRAVPKTLPVARLLALAKQPPGVSGNLKGVVSASGPPLQPIVSANLYIDEAKLSDVALAEASLSLTEHGGTYQLETLLIPEEGGGFTVSGPLPMEIDLASDAPALDLEGLALAVGGDGLPLEIAGALGLPLIDPKGMLSIGGTVTAPGGQPTLDLEAVLSDASFSLEETGVRYEGVGFSLRVKDKHVALRDFQMRARPIWALAQNRGGTLTGKADADINNLEHPALSGGFHLEEFWVSHLSKQQVALSGNVVLSGAWPGLSITGDISVVEGRLVFEEQDFQEQANLALDPAISVVRTVEATQRVSVPPEPPFWSNFQVDLGLDLRRRFRLVADLPLDDSMGNAFADLSTVSMDTVLDAQDLRVGLRGGEAVVNGVVEVVSGSLRVLGSTFDLRDGQVSFIGKDVSDPILEIKATVTKGQYGEVTVSVAGSAASPEITFTSDSDLDQTDILSLLLFGSPPSGLDETQAQSQLGQAILSNVTGSVNRVASSTFMGQVGFDSGAVRVGFPLSDRLMLTYELNYAAESDQNSNQLVFEWLISRLLFAEVVTGDRGVSRADIYWRWRFGDPAKIGPSEQ